MLKKNQKLIVGNWKMNPLNTDEAKRIWTATKKAAKGLSKVVTVACPPFPYFALFKADDSLALGAQNLHFEERGSFTGEVAAQMISSAGASYAIVGHSERRKMGETDEVVAMKTAAALRFDLSTIVCVGEAVHDSQGEYLEFLKNQIKASLAKVQKKQLKSLIVAYEPIWAIGAAEAMTPRDICETALFIKKILSDMFGQEEAMKVPILYGGAVNFRNARDIIVEGQVNGLLVGRESINPPSFTELLKTVDAL